MQCVMSLHQTLQGNERKAKSPARHREAYRSRLVRPGCEVMEDRILLSTALPDHHLTASALIGSAHPWFSVDPVSGGAIAPVPLIMRPFWAFSPPNPPESPSQEVSSPASMLETPEARHRSAG